MLLRLTTALLATTLFATACGSSDDGVSTTTTSPDPTVTPATTATTSSATTSAGTVTTSGPSTTIDLRPRNPLNGMPVEDDTLIDRKVVAVKIDNHANAQPQSGLEVADAVIELEVEAGLTRFIALFLENDTDWLGPIRSVRPTDSTVVAPLNGVLQVSGGQPWIQSRVLADDVALIGEIGAPITMRWSGRNRPHNLYVDTFEIRTHVENRGLDPAPPPQIFQWGEMPTDAAPAVGAIVFDWTNRFDIIWEWTGTEYLRFQDEDPHNWRTQDGETEEQITADTLVVLRTRQYTACPSGDGSCVPASETVGGNEALVFAGGEVATGTWDRDEITDLFTLTDEDGNVMFVPAGRMWIMLYPEDAEISW